MSKKSNNYKLLPRARRDLGEIWLYTYRTWSVEQAEHYHESIVTAFEALADDPNRGISVDHIRAGYRRYRVGSHFIFYRQASRSRIEVIRVLHQQMDFGSHL